MRRHDLALAAATASVAAFASWVGWRLHTVYGVSVSLTLTCAFGITAGLLGQVQRWAERAGTVTHRCDICGFRVRLTAVDAAESGHWREITARHPHHT